MISAKIVAHSICPRSNELATLETVMPRYILAEFNTHRNFTRNSASSRAIRLSKMVSAVLINPFIPYAWQEDHAGMQGTKYLNEDYLFGLAEFADKAKDFFKSEDKDKEVELQHIFMNLLEKPEYMGKKTLKEWWLLARDKAVECASLLNIFGLSKQICNRLLEPFMWHKVLVSATEWENFFELRCPQYILQGSEDIETVPYKSWKDILSNYDFKRETIEDPVMFPLFHNKGQADIHMMFLAEAIYDAKNESTPKQLKEGEWHIPYGEGFDLVKLTQALIDKGSCPGWQDTYETECEYDEHPDSFYQSYLVDAIRKVAIVRCARVSYHIAGQEQVIDYAKDLELYDRLASSGHWSPFEHVAKVMTLSEYEAYTHLSYYRTHNEGSGWCRNFRGFIQQRALMD